MSRELMTREAFRYVLKNIVIPAGKQLWLYGDGHMGAGDIYHPWQGVGDNTISDLNDLDDSYAAVFLNCPKSHEESAGLLALALQKSRGFVMALAPNDAGGNRLTAMLEFYGVAVETLSKSKCKIVWTDQAAKADAAEIAKNLVSITPQEVESDGVKFWSVAGLFGWNKIDAGSKLLGEHLPSDIAGKTADFGCGYGYLSRFLADHCPAVHSIDAYDIDARAVACCAKNGGEKVTAIWQDIRHLAATPLYDVIVMNPPFHTGKAEDIELGKIFLKKAWGSLNPRGRLFVVANQQLPYEKIIPELTCLFAGQGYKIMTGQKMIKGGRTL
jgi:16S rRNA (guanine1207-N2)-methyltransferase